MAHLVVNGWESPIEQIDFHERSWAPGRVSTPGQPATRQRDRIVVPICHLGRSPRPLLNIGSGSKKNPKLEYVSRFTFHVSRKEPPPVTKQPYDAVVVGAGIVGLATARELLHRYPHLRLLV